MAGLFRFHQVFEKEIEAINERRKLLGRGKVRLKSAGDDREGHPVYGPTSNSNLVGLTLSGGGVRSASFCLGVMQALDDAKLMNKVDYLSTVSGGGYIGTSLVAAIGESKNHEFPFPSELEPDEQPALQHVRDHSNFLFRAASAICSHSVDLSSRLDGKRYADIAVPVDRGVHHHRE